MKAELLNINTGKSKAFTLSDGIFSLEPRKDILSRVVRWQLARKQQRSTRKTRSEGSYLIKIYRQKGTGELDMEIERPIFRKGGVYKGPKPRSHSHDLNKKFRKLGIKHALSSKFLGR